jgi:hypothetical protein
LDRYTRRGLGYAIGLGVGMGLMLGAGLFAVSGAARAMSDSEVEKRARGLGMVKLTDPRPAPATPKVVIHVTDATEIPAIAQMLRAAGLVTDEKPFLDRAQSRKAKPGVHVLALPSTLEQIIDAVTMTPTS